ncbi:MAG: DUF4390 domain-containing protein [Magnetococcus sp. DMHC-6]
MTTQRDLPHGQMRFPKRVWSWVFLWLFYGCSSLADSPPPTVIQSSRLITQGDRLYAQAVLKDDFLATIQLRLKQGEALSANYQFRLFLETPVWLPDRRLTSVIFSRRLRPHLITERFEMIDSRNNEVIYSPYTEEALHFFGNPNYIPLLPISELIAGSSYILETRFHVTHDGVSGLFRLLSSWFGFWEPTDWVQQVNYRHS